VDIGPVVLEMQDVSKRKTTTNCWYPVFVDPGRERGCAVVVRTLGTVAVRRELIAREQSLGEGP
jgi:hypothetical protein